jgi:hypothetical protein
MGDEFDARIRTLLAELVRPPLTLRTGTLAGWRQTLA